MTIPMTETLPLTTRQAWKALEDHLGTIRPRAKRCVEGAHRQAHSQRHRREEVHLLQLPNHADPGVQPAKPLMISFRCYR
jgi:hypothetical protein